MADEHAVRGDLSFLCNNCTYYRYTLPSSGQWPGILFDYQITKLKSDTGSPDWFGVKEI